MLNTLLADLDHAVTLLHTLQTLAHYFAKYIDSACATPLSVGPACAASESCLHVMTWAWAVQGVQGISDIITIPGLVNVDFADVKAVMCNSGTAMLGVGVATGKNRAEEAALVCMLCLCDLNMQAELAYDRWAVCLLGWIVGLAW